MSEFIEPLELLIEQFRRLPGVGRKSAVRMAFGVVDMTPEEAERFALTLSEAKRRIHDCPICGNICEGERCAVCADPRRDISLVCVVEDAKAKSAEIRKAANVYADGILKRAEESLTNQLADVKKTRTTLANSQKRS